MNRFSEALKDFHANASGEVREREILRVSGVIRSASFVDVRREVLLWARKRTPSVIPNDAWDGKPIELLSGGRSVHTQALSTKSGNLWTFRNDDPDKTVPGRIWTTEVTVGGIEGEDLLFSVRQLVFSNESHLDIDPHVPGPVLQISENLNFYAGSERIVSKPTKIQSEADVDQLLNLLEDVNRKLPVIIASGDERSRNPGEPLIDMDSIARACAGLAHCFILPAGFTYALSNTFGRARSVFHGGVRVYLPGFSSESRPLDHRLFLAETLSDAAGKDLCIGSLRQLVARHSLIRTRLGVEIVTFASINSAAKRQDVPVSSANSQAESAGLMAMQEQLEATESELAQAKDWETQLTSLYNEVEERALSAEAQAASAAFRIQELLRILESRGADADAEVVYPDNWSDLADWVDSALAGRLVLSPSARRGLKKAKFEDVLSVSKCLFWLATECRKRRMDGGGSIADEAIQEGIRNASCGGDSFDFDFQGKRLKADWHVKNGGNTHDPKRCLRIYYGWDAINGLIVVASLPAHVKTAAS